MWRNLHVGDPCDVGGCWDPPDMNDSDVRHTLQVPSRDGELYWAVTDGPNWTATIRVPEGVQELQRNVRRGDVTLHCTTHVGGGGGRLLVVAGRERVHHFRHGRGAVYALRATVASDRYTRLDIQNRLQAWLTLQDLESRRELSLDSYSRVDVWVQDTRQVLEVQLSDLTETAWEDRHVRYSHLAARCGGSTGLRPVQSSSGKLRRTVTRFSCVATARVSGSAWRTAPASGTGRRCGTG